MRRCSRHDCFYEDACPKCNALAKLVPNTVPNKPVPNTAVPNAAAVPNKPAPNDGRVARWKANNADRYRAYMADYMRKWRAK
jgi:hypothetical protein